MGPASIVARLGEARHAMLGITKSGRNKFVGQLTPAGFFGIVVWLAAIVAAAAAHVAIDILGDYALARDAYDGMTHHSRSIAIAIALALGVIFVLGLLRSALEDGQTSSGAFRALVDRALAVPAYRLVAAVAGLAAIALVAMESLDVMLDAERINSLADAFGGSAPFGLAITLLFALCTGVIAVRLLRTVATAHRAIVATVHALLVRARPSRGTPSAMLAAVALGASPGATSVFSHRAAKRAPPRFFA